jgi:hypothetical protein
MLRFGLVLFAGLTLSGAAHAACTQADLAGTWQIYSAGWNNSYQTWWSRCKATVNGAGTMAGNCTTSLGPTSPMTGASVKLTAGATCTFSAKFTVGSEVNKVAHGTLSTDKTTGSGVGTFPGGAFLFTITKL